MENLEGRRACQGTRQLVRPWSSDAAPCVCPNLAPTWLGIIAMVRSLSTPQSPIIPELSLTTVQHYGAISVSNCLDVHAWPAENVLSCVRQQPQRRRRRRQIVACKLGMYHRLGHQGPCVSNGPDFVDASPQEKKIDSQSSPQWHGLATSGRWYWKGLWKRVRRRLSRHGAEANPCQGDSQPSNQLSSGTDKAGGRRGGVDWCGVVCW